MDAITLLRQREFGLGVATTVNTTSTRCVRPLPFGARTPAPGPAYFVDAHLTSKWDREGAMKVKPLLGHYGCVNAIEFSTSGHFLASGGDDHRVLVWNMDKTVGQEGGSKRISPLAASVAVPKITPFHVMKGQHHSNIFCLAITSDSDKIFSGGNDEQVLSHDVASGRTLDVFNHDEPVYGLSSSPHNPALFASACSDGRLQVFDLRIPPSEGDPLLLANYSTAFHAVSFNPMEPRLICAANHKHGVGLWDLRKTRTTVLQYGNVNGRPDSAMSVAFDDKGTRLFVLRRRLSPVLYDLYSPEVRCEFDHPGYYNSCTMKSCTFAGGDDGMVMSGSDDFNLYMWKAEDDPEIKWVDRAHVVLRGHRSIVNQVRYNKLYGMVGSAGVEKLINLWSPYRFPGEPESREEECDIDEKLLGRKVYSREEYHRLTVEGGSFLSHDYSAESTEENPRMMAFFDTLVQREVEGVSSSSDDDDDNSLGNSPRPVRTSQSHRRSEVDDSGRGRRPNRISQLISRRRQQMQWRSRLRRNVTSARFILSQMSKAKSIVSIDGSSDSSEDEASCASRSSEDECLYGAQPTLRFRFSRRNNGATTNNSEAENMTLDEFFNQLPPALTSQPPPQTGGGIRDDIIRELEEEANGRADASRASDRVDGDIDAREGVEIELSEPVASTSNGLSGPNGCENIVGEESKGKQAKFKKCNKATRSQRNYRSKSEEFGSD